MENTELLKGLSMEELQERNEFTALVPDHSCKISCECGNDL